MRVAIESFRGEVPRVAPRLLPETAATAAINTRLQSGDLQSWRQLAVTKVLANDTNIETIYLLNDKWLSWEADVDVARGPIPGDNTFRTYLTGPDIYDQPRFTNYALATGSGSGPEPYPITTRPLGVPAPDVTPTVVPGVSTLSNPAIIDIIDSGDQFTTAWSSNTPVSETFTRAIAGQDDAFGKGQPSYFLHVQENTLVPCWMMRDFGVADSQVLEYSFDFAFNTATQKRMFAGVLVSSTGAGLGVHWGEDGAFQIGLLPSVDIRGFSPLTGVITAAPGANVFYTCSVQVVTNAVGTRTVTATLYLESAQIASITATNTFTNRGSNMSFMNQIAESGSPDKITWYDNLSIRATPPTAVIEQEATSYVYTFVNDLGEESAPSPPSATVLKDDGTAITVTTATFVQSGFSVDYSVETKRIYRAVSGATGTVFEFVAEIPLSQADYVDELTDAELGDPLETELWDLPPDDLKGILALPNGIMVGFRRNQLCFSAQNHPHAWPVSYRLNTDTDIVGIGNIDTTVVLGTKAFPYLAIGNDPAAYSMTKLEVPQACVSKRSVAYLVGIGVVFASPDGIFAVTGNGQVRNLTEQIFTRRQWRALVPESIVGVAHDDVYHFFYDLDFVPAEEGGGGGGGGGHVCTDAPVWSAGGTGARSDYWRTVTYGNGIFVAAGRRLSNGGGTVQRSTDNGASWQLSAVQPNLPTGGQGYGEHQSAYGAGVFLIVSDIFLDAGASSADGNTWTTINNSAINGSFQLWFGGGKFILSFGNNHITYSADAATFTQVTIPGTSASYTQGGWGDYLGGRHVVVGEAGGTHVSAYSTDGITWTAGGNLPLEPSAACNAVFGAGVFVVAPNSANATLMYSADGGATWQNTGNLTPLGEDFNIFSLHYESGLFVAFGGTGAPSGGAVFFSTDGINWTRSANNLPNNSAFQWAIANNGNGRWVGVADGSGGLTQTAVGTC